MIWEDFGPYVLPYAPGCPDATMEHHARQAAIDFCRATLVWQADLTAIAGNGTATVFAMTMPTGALACKLLAVTINVTGVAPRLADLVTPEEGAERIRDGDLRPCAFTGDLAGLVVWPAQPTTASIVPTVALKPSQAAATFPDVLFNQHANDIACGALATLLSLPKQEWTDMQAASIKAAYFSDRKATIARTVARGAASSRRYSALRWF